MQERTKGLSFKNTIMARFVSENNLKYLKALGRKVFCTLTHLSINMLQMPGKYQCGTSDAANKHLFASVMLSKIQNTGLSCFVFPEMSSAILSIPG